MACFTQKFSNNLFACGVAREYRLRATESPIPQRERTEDIKSVPAHFFFSKKFYILFTPNNPGETKKMKSRKRFVPRADFKSLANRKRTVIRRSDFYTQESKMFGHHNARPAIVKLKNNAFRKGNLLYHFYC